MRLAWTHGPLFLSASSGSGFLLLLKQSFDTFETVFHAFETVKTVKTVLLFLVPATPTRLCPWVTVTFARLHYLICACRLKQEKQGRNNDVIHLKANIDNSITALLLWFPGNSLTNNFIWRLLLPTKKTLVPFPLQHRQSNQKTWLALQPLHFTTLPGPI